ncbi:MAG: adenylate/guanylate cyclase domain-containing protein [Sterolibacterium sp.]|jgi:class 3 adenylate cyclase/CHASE2 domain-containing sensor protein|nr:adenylate/guanylate cyclase domain-containing protein [Sterolibacterium sp.]
MSLPSRPLLWGFLLILVAALGLQASRMAAPLDQQLLDQQFRWLRATQPQPLANDVVIVGIDEKTYLGLKEPYALWHPHLGQLLAGLAQARPAVVGFDVVLPVRAYDFLIPHYDLSLLRGIQTLRATTPLVLGQSIDQRGEVRPIFPPYIALAGGESALASVATCLDDDGVARRYTRDLCHPDTAVTPLSARMAEKLGIPAERIRRTGYIDYSLGDALTYLPLIDVLSWIQQGDTEKLRHHFAGKAVLLGAVLPFEDRHRLPVALSGWEPERLQQPGVLIHAQSLRSLRQHGMIQPLSTSGVLLLAALGALLWWHPGNRYKVALYLATLLALPLLGVWLLTTGTFLPAASLMLCVSIGFLSRLAYESLRSYREKKQLRSAFSGYVSPPVLKEILSGRIKPELGGERIHAAVLFADIRNFTTRSESLSPEKTIDLLNAYFAEMTTAIQNHGGMIDKFIGDGIMASFGAPQPLENASRSAFDAAGDMLARLDQLNIELVQRGHTAVAIGIGIHTGEVLAGHVGSIERHEYTLIGDVVNVASRLEGLTKDVDYPLVCSAITVAASGCLEQFHDLGAQAIKGHSNIHVYGWQPAPARTDVPPPIFERIQP